jgi:hypothetical protein
MSNYTLLVDETGTDELSKRIIYVGCLLASSELAGASEKIQQFNTKFLDEPRFSYRKGLVNSTLEPRHYSQESISLRDQFIKEVVLKTPCRVYAVYSKPEDNLAEVKKRTFNGLLHYVHKTKRIDDIEVIVEKSEVDSILGGKGISFRDKSFLPLSLADYFCGILRDFNAYRLKVLSGEEKLDLNHHVVLNYHLILDRVSIEVDLSTGERSSRHDGRYFWNQINSIVKKD